MTDHRPDPGPPARLTLPAELDMRAAAPLKQALAEHRDHDIDLDGAAVVRLGGQCLQVILAAARDWSARGRRLRLVAPSSALAEHLVLLGVPPASPLLETAE